MLKRLIEVALPLKEVSQQCVRESKVREGHIRTLHIWWARRPLAACRAIVLASLIPDPDDPTCPDTFRQIVRDVLGASEFKPKNREGSTIEDTPRNRCLEFIKNLVRWENSNNPTYIDPARKLIAAAHKLMHRENRGEAPKVLDPFAGGGAIPLEAMRLGCESHAVDLNPVAHLIELCTLVYPQKYGQPDSRPVPDYIKRLISNNKAKEKAKCMAGLFDGEEEPEAEAGGDLIPDVEMTEAEYRKNPLAADLKYWGDWVLQQVRREIGQFYLGDADGGVPLAYLWARTVICPNPACGVTIPLVRQLWLCKKPKRKVAMRLVLDAKAKLCRFEVIEGNDIDFDPNKGTMQQGKAACPFCQMIVDGKALRSESKAKRMGQQMTAVVTTKQDQKGKKYRPATALDEAAYHQAVDALEKAKAKYGAKIVPDEPMTPDRPSPNSRGLSAVVRYGLDNFGDLFNPRQALGVVTALRHIQGLSSIMDKQDDPERVRALKTLLACALDKCLDFASTLCRWGNDDEGVTGTFGRQALQMVWDYAESNPLQNRTGGLGWAIRFPIDAVTELSQAARNPCVVLQGNACQIPFDAGSIEAIITDPPYYDSVPYGDLSDYFYVWLKRTLGTDYPLLRTPLTPKNQELIAYYGKGKRKVQKLPEWYEAGMQEVFAEAHRVVTGLGLVCVMFAHKTTAAWETLIGGLIRAGLVVTASWPLHTEMKNRLVARNAAALASSVTLICRKRQQGAGDGLWDDVRGELQQLIRERLDFFWSQDIRGADFFISAIGPALSVFGKYERVTKLSGEEVTVGQFLDEVRSFVSNYALTKILKTTQMGIIDPESRFYVVWKWSYADAKVPADESFKLSQALGLNSETLWDKTGVLEKGGENVQATPVSKRIKIKNLGEPTADGAPASLIDVLHRMCAFREKNDTPGMVEFLGRSGQANNHSLWLVAQAVSEILPDGDKEKQLMQGLLNQKESLEEAAREKKLF